LESIESSNKLNIDIEAHYKHGKPEVNVKKITTTTGSDQKTKNQKLE
jgi:hypothetical protein